jgi:hypothetical protein
MAEAPTVVAPKLAPLAAAARIAVARITADARTAEEETPSGPPTRPREARAAEEVVAVAETPCCSATKDVSGTTSSSLAKNTWRPRRPWTTPKRRPWPRPHHSRRGRALPLDSCWRRHVLHLLVVVPAFVFLLAGGVEGIVVLVRLEITLLADCPLHPMLPCEELMPEIFVMVHVKGSLHGKQKFLP